MTLEEAKSTFYKASATLSDNARKLCFAGIAIIWIFKVGDKTAGGIDFDAALISPLRVFVLALIFDGLQYLYKSVAWWLYYSIKHAQNVSDATQVHPPGLMNLPTQIFFFAKVLCCGYGYYALLRFLSQAIAHSGVPA
jgi:hypothetical protein